MRFLMIVLALALPLASLTAKAETTRHTKTTTTTTVESDDDGAGYAPPEDAIPAPRDAKPPVAPSIESTLTQTFGSTATSGTAGCKTEALSKAVVKDLKRECSAWVKEQKADLGKSYRGNTCEDSCEDCGMSLVRCKVTGTIRYTKTTENDSDIE
jgi:hypothetical protein